MLKGKDLFNCVANQLYPKTKKITYDDIFPNSEIKIMVADKKPFLGDNSISNYVIDEAINNNIDLVKKTKLEEIKEEKQKRKYNQRKRG